MVIPWIIVSIVILLVLLAVAAFVTWKYSKGKHEPDYYALFVIGMCWVPLGIPLENYALTVMGIIFMVIGLVHKDKWKRNRKDWGHLKPEEKKVKMIILGLVLLLFLLGLVFFFLAESGMLS